MGNLAAPPPRDPAAVRLVVGAMNHDFAGEHPLQRLTIRHPSGSTVRVTYQASPEVARYLATTYKNAIGWPDATIEEGHDAQQAAGGLT